jgi:RNA polymerase sigma factor FliA
MDKKTPLDMPENQAKLNDFLAEYAPLINMHVKKLKNEGKIPEGIDESDLHVAGFHGLVDALHKYDPNVGANFQTYGGRRIRGKMLDHIVEQGAIPKSVMTQAKNIKALKPGPA